MRIYLLPISTRRTLLYAQRLHDASTAAAAGTPPKSASYMDRGTAFAAKTWAKWEKKESGWQRKVVDLGNQAFRRIPYEEWGLKSVPPLAAHQRNGNGDIQQQQQQQQQQMSDVASTAGKAVVGADKVDVVFPAAAIPKDRAEGLVRTLATEREALHKRRLIWCFVGMPITAPFALVPVIPNLPFFYLVYRAWSHWRALAGGKHLRWLLDRNLLVPKPSPILDKLYASRLAATTEAGAGSEGKEVNERMLLTQDQVRGFSETLDVPALEIELERAIWQVEQSLHEPSEGTANSAEQQSQHSENTTTEREKKDQ